MTADALAGLDVLEALVVSAVALTARSIAILDADLTLLQWRAILVVGRDERGATVSKIAGEIGTNLSPASRLLGRLATRGIVAGAKDTRDRRATRMTLTDAGRALRSEVIASRRAALRLVLAKSPMTPAEAAAVARLARALAGNE